MVMLLYQRVISFHVHLYQYQYLYNTKIYIYIYIIYILSHFHSPLALGSTFPSFDAAVGQHQKAAHHRAQLLFRDQWNGSPKASFDGNVMKWIHWSHDWGESHSVWIYQKNIRHVVWCVKSGHQYPKANTVCPPCDPSLLDLPGFCCRQGAPAASRKRC